MTLKKVYKNIRKVIIYEIVCNETGDRYIGSTIKKLNHRILNHCDDKNKCKSIKIINRNNYKVNELEKFNTRFELCVLLKEQYYIDNTININYKRALDLFKKNRKLYLNNWRNENKTINKKKRQIIRKNQVSINCNCGGSYKHRNKSKHLQTKRHKKYIDSI
jgi:hypothetical protein